MRIDDLILALQRGVDPNAAIMAQAQTPGPTPPVPNVDTPAPAPSSGAAMPDVPIPRPRPPEAPPAPAPGTPPPGVQTPITNPMPADQAPRTIQSPPDLANMYLKLIEKNQNAHALDSGLSLIAAGLSKYPENRAALIRGAADQKQHQLTGADLVNLQKVHAENQALGIRQAAKAGLMKKYNLDRDTLDYLDAS